MNKAEHYGEWAALWEEAKDVSKRKTSWDRNARESFELVAMALIYQRNAIEMYEEGTLHGALRTSEAGAGPSIPWPSGEPLFPKMMESTDAKLGNSFIASASLRLPVAVLKAIESFVSPFAPLLKGDGDWSRAALATFFGTVKEMGCCDKASALGSSGSERLRHSLVIMSIHRDDFAHGEVGHPPDGDYKKRRESVLDSLHVCRILESQRVLCRWTLKWLTERQ